MKFFKIRWLGSAVLAVFLSGCDFGITVSDVEYVYQAREHMEKGEVRAAVIEFKNALAANPDNAEARWMLGELYLDLGDGASAEKELDRALRLGVPMDSLQLLLVRSWFLQRKHDEIMQTTWSSSLPEPHQAELMSLQGEVLIQQLRLEEALKILGRARQQFPAAPAPLAGLARIAAAQRQFDKAVGLLDEALALDENHAVAWSLKGDVARYQGKPEQAVEFYGQAVDLRMNQMADLEKRAILLTHLQRFDEARQDIGFMAALNPRHPAVPYVTGMLEFQEKNYSDAQLNFQKALAIVENYKQSIYYLGLVNLASGNLQQAELYLGRFFARHPQFVPGRTLLATVRLQSGNADSAVQLLAPVVEQMPDNSRARSLYATALLRQGHKDAAVEQFQLLVGRDPDSAVAKAQLGIGLLMQGDVDSALSTLQNAVSQQPGLAQADIMIVLTYLKQGAFDQAVEAAEGFRKRFPKDPLPLTFLGMAHVGAGDRDLGREQFLAALELEPANPSANNQLALLAVEEERFDDARKRYQSVLTVNPSHFPTLRRLAMLEAQADNEQAMIETLQRGIEGGGQGLEFALYLGRYYLQKGQPERALGAVLELRKTHARAPDLLALIGEAHLNSGDFTSARAEFGQLVELAPEEAQGYYLLAKACGRMRDRHCLKAQLAQALKKDPKHLASRIDWGHVLVQEERFHDVEEILSGLKAEGLQQSMRTYALEGALAMAAGQLERAQKVYREALKYHSTTPMVVALAKAKWAAGDQDGAMQELVQWAEKHPRDIPILLVIANNYNALERPRDAAAIYRQVIEQVPDQVLALNNLAALTTDDDARAALDLARRALRASPENPLVLDTLVTILIELDQATEANSLVEGVLNRSHRGPDARYLHARLLQAAGERGQARQALLNLLDETQDFALVGEARKLLETLAPASS